MVLPAASVPNPASPPPARLPNDGVLLIMREGKKARKREEF